jgi:hypothetical protein
MTYITRYLILDTHQAEYLAEERCGIVAAHMFGTQAIRQAQGRSVSNRKECEEDVCINRYSGAKSTKEIETD